MEKLTEYMTENGIVKLDYSAASLSLLIEIRDELKKLNTP